MLQHTKSVKALKLLTKKSTFGLLFGFLGVGSVSYLTE